jgi:hypothetical protein
VKIHVEDLTDALSDARKAVETAPEKAPHTWLVYILRAQLNYELRSDGANLDAAFADLSTAGGMAGPMAGPINSLRNRWVKAPRGEK